MYVSSITMIDNAAYSMMNDASSTLSLTRNASSTSNVKALSNAEKSNQTDMLNQELTYKAAGYMEDSEKKVRDEDIKRNFTMFA